MSRVYDVHIVLHDGEAHWCDGYGNTRASAKRSALATLRSAGVDTRGATVDRIIFKGQT